MDVTQLLESVDPLRLLAEYDEQDQAYVVHSVDTGAVASGRTLEDARALLTGILENDIRIAYTTNSLESLFHSSAPPDVRLRWIEAKAANPGNFEMFTLNPPGDPHRRGVQSELRVWNAKTA